jgi:hypothetical protein
MKVLARIMSKTLQLEGATALFHANSVATARTLLEEGALLCWVRSRVEGSRKRPKRLTRTTYT